MSYMYCENHFCIYWTERGCTLDNVSLDMQGSCLECTYVNISEQVLKAERQKILKHLKEEYTKWE